MDYQTTCFLYSVSGFICQLIFIGRSQTADKKTPDICLAVYLIQ